MAGLLDTGAGPKWVNKVFFLCCLKESIKPIRAPQFQTANHEVVNVEKLVPLFVEIGNLRLRTMFEIVENLGFDEWMRTSFIDWRIHGIYTTERKGDVGYPRAVAIVRQRRISNYYSPIVTCFTTTKILQIRQHATTIVCVAFCVKWRVQLIIKHVCSSIVKGMAHENWDPLQYCGTQMFHDCASSIGKSSWKTVLHLHLGAFGKYGEFSGSYHSGNGVI